jgi:HEAT repeat protein
LHPAFLCFLQKLTETFATKEDVMKKLNRQLSVSATILVATLFLLMNTVSFAQVNSEEMTSIKELSGNKFALQNLVASIKSDNPGVKRSSIYLAGKYRIAESEDALIDQLKIEKDPSTRILIALVLYEMGSDKGLPEIRKLSQADNNLKVRRMATQIYNEYLINDSERTASLSK